MTKVIRNRVYILEIITPEMLVDHIMYQVDKNKTDTELIEQIC